MAKRNWKLGTYRMLLPIVLSIIGFSTANMDDTTKNYNSIQLSTNLFNPYINNNDMSIPATYHSIYSDNSFLYNQNGDNLSKLSFLCHSNGNHKCLQSLNSNTTVLDYSKNMVNNPNLLMEYYFPNNKELSQFQVLSQQKLQQPSVLFMVNNRGL